MRKALIALLVLACATSGWAAFPAKYNSVTVNVENVTGKYDSFSWKWTGFNTQSNRFYFTQGDTALDLDAYSMSFKVSMKTDDGQVDYIIVTNSLITKSGAVATFNIAYTNVPMSGEYVAEMRCWEASSPLRVRAIAQGAISVSDSIWDADADDFTFPSWSGTLSDASDCEITSPAQGDVLYRGASLWNNLAAGTSGYVLTTAGASANPTWTAKTTDTDTHYTNYFAFTGPGTYTGAVRSGSNTLTQILSDFTGIGLLSSATAASTYQTLAVPVAANSIALLNAAGQVIDGQYPINTAQAALTIPISEGGGTLADAWCAATIARDSEVIAATSGVYSAAAIGWAASDVTATNGVFINSTNAAATSAAGLYASIARTITINGDAGTLSSNLEWTVSASGGMSATNLAYTNVMTLTSAAIQGANDTLATAGGGRINLTEGTYVMAAAGINISNNIELVGAGWGTILDATGQQQTDAVVDIIGSGVLIANLQILTDRAGGSAHNVMDSSSAGSALTVRKVYFNQSDMSQGVFAGSYTRVVDCYFEDSDAVAITLNGTYSIAQNNIIDNQDTTGIQLGGTYTTASKNFFFTVGQVSINVTGAGAVVEGNQINGNYAGNSGITLAAYHITCTGNHIYRAGNNGINLTAGAVFCTVQGNTMRESGNGYADIKLSGSSHCSIIGNACRSTAGRSEQGIHLDNADDNTVIGNTFFDHDQAGIQIDADCDRNLVSGNTFQTEVDDILDNSATTIKGLEHHKSDGLLYAGDDILELKAKVAQTNLNSATWSPSASYCYGMLWYNLYTNTSAITLPSGVDGMNFSLYNTTNAYAVTLRADSTDGWILNDGSTTTNAGSVVSSGAVDDKISATFNGTLSKWIIGAEQNAWTDAGP